MSYAKSSNDTSRDRARSEAAQTPETDVGERTAEGTRRKWQKLSPDFERYVLEFLSGEICSRSGLPLKQGIHDEQGDFVEPNGKGLLQVRCSTFIVTGAALARVRRDGRRGRVRKLSVVPRTDRSAVRLVKRLAQPIR